MNKLSATQTYFFIDTHCHLDLIINPTFNTSLNEILLSEQQIQQAALYIEQARQANIQKIVNVGASLVSTHNIIALAQRYPELYVVAGLHPEDLSANWSQDFEQIKELVKYSQQHKIVGIGETGIDRYHPGYNLARQIDSFKAHIELALAYNLALVVHSREAAQETLATLSEYKKNIKHCIMHCYAYDLNYAHEFIAINCHLGIGGTVTYPKNFRLQSIVHAIDLKNIVLETDAPYLPPQIIRGKQNTPAQIYTIAQEVARLKNISIEEVARITSNNACAIFKIN